jgi:hypothetical protein
MPLMSLTSIISLMLLMRFMNLLSLICILITARRTCGNIALQSKRITTSTKSGGERIGLKVS